jgi:hypothetical protein
MCSVAHPPAHYGRLGTLSAGARSARIG